MEKLKYQLLSEINTPEDLRKLEVSQLPQLCDELRQFILNVISNNPGHLGASLGVVELTVAIHYVFDTPFDNLIWDVGHQCYPHKILTGRKEQFHTIRKFNGISGFPKISESEYDNFGTGHASTSISAALGMAIAAEQLGEKNRNHIAVIGDGSMTGGMAFEAMNNAGSSKANLLIILNDNGMSIDKSVGGLKDSLLRMATSKPYNKFRNKIWALKSNPQKHFVLRQIKRNLKSAILFEGNLFESLGLRYFGPSDGHDVAELVEVLTNLKEIKGPKILHCVTLKGKGYDKAECDQVRFHAPGAFDIDTGKPKEQETIKKPPKYQDVFGYTITRLAETNDKIVGITPAMPTGTSLNMMMQKFPERSFDVGICESHAVTFAAGMAERGLKPYCVIYSTFLQRAYDNIMHDVALQNEAVVLCIDRAGLVGEDGPTHHGAFDMAYLKLIPNMIICSPINEIEMQNMLFTAQIVDRPMAIRYPRARAENIDWIVDEYQKISIGKGQKLVEGNDIAIISIGPVGNAVTKAIHQLEKEGISPSHYDLRFLKPLDLELLHEACDNHENIITVEDGTIEGGMGTSVIEFVAEHNYKCKVKKLGIPDEFIEHGSLAELHKLCGYDVEAIFNTVKQIVES